ncbi:MAG: hypothetical protein C0623_13965 [Desulfuromonas sp.]|nr:MAG: hypothetical protein C0623_13965 [Desulfuromonas sp.]
MFKLPKKPSPKASVTELADFVEILAWVERSASAQRVVNYLGLVDDQILNEDDSYQGCEDQEDEHQEYLEDVFAELAKREEICNEAYPFEINGTAGTVLHLKPNVWDNPQQTAYLYLLAATRLNMNKDHNLEDIDGALEMEFLSAHALKQYLGAVKSTVMVFGTSDNAGRFSERVDELMVMLKEKGRFRNINGTEAPIHAQDDKLDVIGTIPFTDGRGGQLIVFAQSKTGTNWKSHISELRPEVFAKKWISHDFLIPPLRAYCIAESVDEIEWASNCAEAGLLFDRCRLVECCIEDDTNKLPENIRAWTQAAQTRINSYISA